MDEEIYEYYIYKITNNINGKIYVGQHKIRKNESPREYMGKGTLINEAYKKYGRGNFTKVIIEYIEDNAKRLKVSERERYWIAYYNSEYPNGYNMNNGGFGGCDEKAAKKVIETRKRNGYKMTEETKKKISESNKGKKLSKEHKKHLSENHHLIKEWKIIKEDGNSFIYIGSLEKLIKEYHISSRNKFIRYSYYHKFINGIYADGIKKEDYAILRDLKGENNEIK